MKPSMRTKQICLPTIAFETFWNQHDELYQLVDDAGGYLVDFNEEVNTGELMARIQHGEETFRVVAPNWNELKAKSLALPLFTENKER